MYTDIATQYQELRAQLGRKNASEDEIVLVAVCKSQSLGKIEAVLSLGQKEFGENKVQEAVDHWQELKERFPETRLHLIGPLQSNKAKEAVSLFDVIETVDRIKIAEAISKEAVKQKKTMECFVQVDIGDEPQKAGVAVSELASLLDYCRTLENMHITGLMCVPPADESPAPYFALMQKLAKEHGLEKLSMGMSGDFQTAIKFGATHVRIGTALFGERA